MLDQRSPGRGEERRNHGRMEVTSTVSPEILERRGETEIPERRREMSTVNRRIRGITEEKRSHGNMEVKSTGSREILEATEETTTAIRVILERGKEKSTRSQGALEINEEKSTVKEVNLARVEEITREAIDAVGRSRTVGCNGTDWRRPQPGNAEGFVFLSIFY